MHLDPHALAPHLPLLWDQLNVHERIEIMLGDVEYGQEAIESSLVFDVAEVLRAAGLDVRVMLWRLEGAANEACSKLSIWALRLDGVDWTAEGEVGEAAMGERWRASFFPKTAPADFQMTCGGDETHELHGPSPWLSKLIGAPLLQLVAEVAAQQLDQATPATDAAHKTTPRL